ncbi:MULTISPECIES: lipase family protein [unclassified Streptomyces]|uniref:lipase family protein n=1 Tax=unclassified Streptomyces TaxID=2593676 RepID=UPI001905F783|nr:lipase family protein [Streptomyces sp. HSG2]
MPARSRLLASAVAATLAVGALAVPATAADGTAAVVSRGVEIPAFYTPPATLPADDGTLVRTEPLTLALSGLSGVLPGEATRLMYKSTNSNGDPVAVTGAYLEPTERWTEGGPRPLVAVAPGTMGQGDQCAASMGLERPLTMNGQTMSVGYEDVVIHRLLSDGIAVVLTDYVGLGATDRLHTYVNRVDGAHAVLDAVRAARSLESASVTDASPVGLFGYSEGGGATAAAAELQPSYAPDVELAGTYAGAPPADLAEVTEGIDGGNLAGALAWAFNGFLESDPTLREVADRQFNATGIAALEDLAGMCVGDAVLGYRSTRSSEWTTSGQPVSEVIRDEPALRAFVEEQRLGTLKPAGPVRVATGIADDLVPHAQSRDLAVDWCDKGAQVTYKAILVPGVGNDLLDHVSPLLADQGSALDWLSDRLAGEKAGSNCWTMRFQP